MAEGTGDEGTVVEGADVADDAAVVAAGADGASDDAEGVATEGAPEAYADFTFPDGVTADKTLMEKFLPMGKELNLTQVQMQGILDLNTEGVLAAAKAQEAAYTEAKDAWTAELKADKDLGGDNYDKTIAAGKTALDKLGSPELKDLVNGWDLHTHPQFAKFFAAVAHAIGEDSTDPGHAGPGERDQAQIMFGETMNAS